MLKTPQFPNGRDIIVIGNDITYKIGSFGPREDVLYKVRKRLKHLILAWPVWCLAITRNNVFSLLLYGVSLIDYKQIITGSISCSGDSY